jgi:hypothetical protein
MYLPTLSASCLVSARTLLWTEKPEWRQLAILSTTASEIRPSLRRRAKTSREKNSASRRKPYSYPSKMLAYSNEEVVRFTEEDT